MAWVMVPFGILMPAIRPPDTVPEGDNRNLQVRARRAYELDILRDEYMGELLGPTIHTPQFDYEYRAYCTHKAFADAMAKLIMGIDYKKFKPTTDRYLDQYPKEQRQLHTTYNRIWSVVFSEHSTPTHKAEYLRPYSKYNTTGTSISSIPSARKSGYALPGSYSSYSKYPPAKDEDDWIVGTPYEDPDFKGFSSSEWMEGDYDPLDLSDVLTAEDEDVKEDVAETVNASLIDVETVIADAEAEISPEFNMTSDQLATCLRVPVKKVRQFLRSDASRWEPNGRGHYEVPFPDFEEMARTFYVWQDTIKAKRGTE